MPEHSQRGLAVVVDHETYACDQCGGQVKFDGRTLLVDPPKYENVCAGCGRVYVLDKPYPTTTFYAPGCRDASRVVLWNSTAPPIKAVASLPATPATGAVPDNDM